MTEEVAKSEIGRPVKTSALMKTGNHLAGQVIRQWVVNGEPTEFLKSQDRRTDVELCDACKAAGSLWGHWCPG